MLAWVGSVRFLQREDGIYLLVVLAVSQTFVQTSCLFILPKIRLHSLLSTEWWWGQHKAESNSLHYILHPWLCVSSWLQITSVKARCWYRSVCINASSSTWLRSVWPKNTDLPQCFSPKNLYPFLSCPPTPVRPLQFVILLADVKVWAFYDHFCAHSLPGSNSKEDQTIRSWSSIYSTSYPPPLLTDQALLTQVQEDATPPQQSHLPPPRLPPAVVCLCKCPWPWGLWWEGSPESVAPVAWSWTKAGHRDYRLDPAERRRHLDAPATTSG